MNRCSVAYLLFLVLVWSGCSDDLTNANEVGDPQSISVISGNGQAVPPRSTLPISPIIEVKDQEGIPIPGIVVNFEVIKGNGVLVSESATSDADGRVTLSGWQLGPGMNLIKATVGGSTLTTLILATGVVSGVRLAVDEGHIVYGGVMNDQPLIVDSTALVAVVQGNKSFLYHASLGPIPSNLNDDISRKSLALKLMSNRAGGVEDVADKQDEYEVAGVVVSEIATGRYRFENTKRRMAGIKFIPEGEGIRILPPRGDLISVSPLAPVLGTGPLVSVLGDTFFERTLENEAVCQVFGSTMTYAFGGVPMINEWLRLFKPSIEQAIQSDPDFFAQVNRIDATLMVLDVLEDVVGLVPSACVDALFVGTLLRSVEILYLQNLSDDLGAEAVQQAAEDMFTSLLTEGALCLCEIETLGACTLVSTIEDLLSAGALVIDDFILRNIDVYATSSYEQVVLGNGDSGQPDLSVGLITFNPPNPTESDSVAVNFTLENLGNAASGSFEWQLSNNGIVLATESATTLQAGQSLQLAYNLGTYSVGTYSIRVEVDPSGVISESDEFNNDQTENLIILGGSNGTIEVSNSTTGQSIPTAPYTAILDVSDANPQTLSIPVNGSVSFSDVEPGSHTITLGGVDENCTVSGGITQNVTVTAGSTAAVSFNITCESIATEGTIEVSNSTTGQSIPTAPYTAILDVSDANPQTLSIPVNGSVSFSDVEPGSHTITLGGVDENCTVSGGITQNVTVTAGSTAAVSFNITCESIATEGTIEVSNSTTGQSIPTAPYTAILDVSDANPQTLSIPVNGSVSFSDVEPGSHTITLGGVDENCTVSGGITQNVTVTAGSTAAVSFNITCESIATEGTIEVSNSTTGQSIPTAPYTAILDVSDANPQTLSIPVNGSVSFSDVEPGSHTITLGGVDENCTVSGGITQNVTVTAGSTAAVSFNITCESIATEGTIEVSNSTTGQSIPTAPYTAILDVSDANPQTLSIPVNGSVSFSDVEPGSHTITLGGVDENCTVSGGITQNVTVTAGSTAAVSFNITCESIATEGTIEVSNSTTGQSIPTAPYTAILDVSDANPQTLSIPVNGSVSFSDVEPGSHTITLGGVDENCTVSGGITQNVTVTAGSTAAVSFNITCESIATEGTIEVSNSTTGQSIPTAPYTAILDVSDANPQTLSIPVNGSVSFSDVEPGSHTITLGGVDENCTVSGGITQNVTVTAGSTAAVSFNITCESIATEGTIEVSNSTTGQSIPTAPYTAILDVSDANPQTLSIPVNGSVSFSDVEPGSHTITLGGVDENCTVSGGITQNVTVTAGSTAAVSFNITCESIATEGTIEVSNSTTGQSIPTAPYTAILDVSDANPQTLSIPVNGSVSFSDVEPGSHTITLGGVDENCTVSGGITQNVTVTAGSTAAVSFNITCESIATEGTIEVSNSTTGQSIPTAPYTAILDVSDANPQTLSIPVNGSVSFSDVEPGSHTITLGGVDENCTVSGGITQNVTVTAGSTAAVSFNITCESIATGSIEVINTTTGLNIPTAPYTAILDVAENDPPILSIPVNGSVTFSNVSTGSHTITLGGVDANCTVSGGITKSVIVSSGSTTIASYSITCE